MPYFSSGHRGYRRLSVAHRVKIIHGLTALFEGLAVVPMSIFGQPARGPLPLARCLGKGGGFMKNLISGRFIPG
ncbi:hypothetical protein [Candidatus Methylobacter favarea]|uniref:hypothetical protein n=1 Tax=Candidatus Methylobacter favarea TaxID=2707345 RepID=UPI001C2D536E|nr:hypothetical protein [Candidatus Methylobacter favarea]